MPPWTRPSGSSLTSTRSARRRLNDRPVMRSWPPRSTPARGSKAGRPSNGYSPQSGGRSASKGGEPWSRQVGCSARRARCFYPRRMPIIGDLVRNTRGQWITQPPSRCPTGTPSAPAKCSSATKPVSGTAAAIRLGRAAHAIRRCTGRRSTNTARALQGPASRVCICADLQQIVHRSPISAKRLPSRFLGNDPPHHSDSHDDDSQHGKQVV